MSLFEKDVFLERCRFKRFHNLDLPKRNACSHFCPPALSPCSLAESGPCKPLEQGGNPEKNNKFYSFVDKRMLKDNSTLIKDFKFFSLGFDLPPSTAIGYFVTSIAV